MQQLQQLSYVFVQSKHRAPPPPAYGSPNAQPGKTPKEAKDTLTTPPKEQPGTSTHAPAGSAAGASAYKGPAMPQSGPTTGTSSKPAQTATAPSGPATSQNRAPEIRVSANQSGQIKAADIKNGHVQPPPKLPQQSSSEASKPTPASSSSAAGISLSQAAKPVTSGTVSPQPVKNAPELAATEVKASQADRPTSSALGTAETHGAKAETLALSSAASAAKPGPAGSKAQQQYYTGNSLWHSLWLD